jgi:hypothetical protein
MAVAVLVVIWSGAISRSILVIIAATGTRDIYV